MNIEILGGLTSRLWVMSSIYYHLSNQLDQINLIWKPAPGISCYFDNLFINDMGILSYKAFNKSKIQILGTDSRTLLLAKSSSIITAENFKEIKNIGYEEIYQLVHTNNYILIDQPLWGPHANNDTIYNHFRQFVSSLKMLPSLQKIHDKYAKQITKNTIGINIRGCQNTINANRVSGIDLERYIRAMRLKEKEKSNANFLITTGDLKYIVELRKQFPNKIIAMNELTLDCGYSTTGCQRALIEWLLLSRCRIAITANSGYAIKACKYGDVPRETL